MGSLFMRIFTIAQTWMQKLGLPLLLASSALLTVNPALAQAQPSIKTLGVFSLLGDGLQLVYPTDVTDTRLDRNQRESLPTKDIGFDQAALRAVRETLARQQPQASMQMFRSNTVMEPAAQRALAEGAAKAELPAWIVGTIQSAKLSHILLITRNRGDANFPLLNGHSIGRGTVEGIGYYVDRGYEIKNLDTGLTSQGFLGAYAMLRLQLMDANTGDMLASQDVRVGEIYAGRNDKEIGNIWDALGPREKVEVLRKMVQDNVARVMPAVLAGR
jgi:hypothetical protein